MGRLSRSCIVGLLLALAACATPSPQRCSGGLEPINAPQEPRTDGQASHEQ
jgi:hypothetical protein